MRGGGNAIPQAFCLLHGVRTSREAVRGKEQLYLLTHSHQRTDETSWLKQKEGGCLFLFDGGGGARRAVGGAELAGSESSRW